MIRRRAPLAASVAVASSLLLSGCAFFGNTGIHTDPQHLTTVALWGNLEVASLVMTKKTLFDHIATWVTGENCSSVRAANNGRYCVAWPRGPAPPPSEYCYASLAEPDCYAEPFNGGNDRLIGFVPPAATAMR